MVPGNSEGIQQVGSSQVIAWKVGLWEGGLWYMVYIRWALVVWLHLFDPDCGGWISKQIPRQDLMCQQRDWEIRQVTVTKFRPRHLV